MSKVYRAEMRMKLDGIRAALFEMEDQLDEEAEVAADEETMDELDNVRPIFDAMIGAGVQDDVANCIMTLILDHLHPTESRYLVTPA